MSNKPKTSPLPSTPFLSRTPSPSINYPDSPSGLKSISPLLVNSPSPSLLKNGGYSSGLTKLLSPNPSPSLSINSSPVYSRTSSPNKRDKLSSSSSNSFTLTSTLSQSPQLKVPKPIPAANNFDCDPFDSFSYHNNSDYNLNLIPSNLINDYTNLSDEDDFVNPKNKKNQDSSVNCDNDNKSEEIIYSDTLILDNLALREERFEKKFTINIINQDNESVINNQYYNDNFYGSYHDPDEITDEDSLKNESTLAILASSSGILQSPNNSESLSSLEDNNKLLKTVLNKGLSSTNSLNEEYRPSINFSEDRTSVECDASLPSFDSMNSLNSTDIEIKKRNRSSLKPNLTSPSQGILLENNPFNKDNLVECSNLDSLESIESNKNENNIDNLNNEISNHDSLKNGNIEELDEDEQEIIFVDEEEHELALIQNFERRKYGYEGDVFENNSTNSNSPALKNSKSTSSFSNSGSNSPVKFNNPYSLSVSDDLFDDFKNKDIEVLYVGSDESSFYNIDSESVNVKSTDPYDIIYSRKLSYVSSSDEEYLINNTDRNSIYSLNDVLIKNKDSKFHFFDSDSDEEELENDDDFDVISNKRVDISSNNSLRSSLVLSLGESLSDSDEEIGIDLNKLGKNNNIEIIEKIDNIEESQSSLIQLNLVPPNYTVDDYGAKFVQVSDSEDENEPDKKVKNSSSSYSISNNSLNSLKLEVSDDDTVNFTLSSSSTPVLESNNSFSKNLIPSNVSSPLSLSSNSSISTVSTSNIVPSYPSPHLAVATQPNLNSNNLNLSIDLSDTNSDILPPKSVPKSLKRLNSLTIDTTEPSNDSQNLEISLSLTPSLSPSFSNNGPPNSSSKQLDIFSPSSQNGLPPTSPSNIRFKNTSNITSHTNLSPNPSTSSRVFTFDNVQPESENNNPISSVNSIPQSPSIKVDKKLNQFSSPLSISSRSNSSSSNSSLNSPRWSISRMFSDWYSNSPLASPSNKSRSERSNSLSNSNNSFSNEFEPIQIHSQIHSPLDDSIKIISNNNNNNENVFKLPLTSSPSVLFASKEKKLSQIRRR